jgi:hypothetical protein
MSSDHEEEHAEELSLGWLQRLGRLREEGIGLYSTKVPASVL